jgi:protein TonB
MTRALPFRSPQALQFERILGIAVALLAQTGLFMLLMRPPEFNPPVVASEPPPIQWIFPKKPVVVPAQPRPISRPQMQPRPQSQQRVEHQPVVTEKQTLVNTNARIEQTVTVDTVTLSPPPAESSLAPIVAPLPGYPRDAFNEGITGTVELELLVGVDGRVLEARVVRSSGNRQLDNAARDTVLRQWRFQPATRGGVPVQALGRLPVVFSLDDR